MFRATEPLSAEVEFKPEELDIPIGTFNQEVLLADKEWRAQETLRRNPNRLHTESQHCAKYLPMPAAGHSLKALRLRLAGFSTFPL